MSSKKAPPTAASEREILFGVLRILASLGIPAQRQNTGAMIGASGRLVRFGKAGNADISATIPIGPNRGKRLEIEVKRKGKTPSPKQWKRIREVNSAGGIAFWTDDAESCFNTLYLILGGSEVETDENGNQWLVGGTIEKGDPRWEIKRRA